MVEAVDTAAEAEAAVEAAAMEAAGTADEQPDAEQENCDSTDP